MEGARALRRACPELCRRPPGGRTRAGGGAPVMLSEAKQLWLARSFGLRPQDDGRRGLVRFGGPVLQDDGWRGLVPFGGPVLQDDGWRGLVPFGGPVLSCAGGLRASGRGQAGAPVMLSEAKQL